MNDKELDQLLDSWEAPPPPRSLREGVRERFPRAERRRIAHPLRWVIVAGVASVALALGMEQTGASPWDFRVGQAFTGVYEHIRHMVDIHHASYTVGIVRNSQPKVYVNGQLAGSLQFKHATRIDVDVPGEGVFSVVLVPGLEGFTEAGTIHGNVIEFQAGSKQVRIECNSQLVHSERPVSVRMRR
jgi:hypothetical protein